MAAPSSNSGAKLFAAYQGVLSVSAEMSTKSRIARLVLPAASYEGLIFVIATSFGL